MDKRLANVLVKLYSWEGKLLGQTITDEKGDYVFGTKSMAEAAKFPTGLQRMNILASMRLPCQELMEKKVLPRFGFPLFSAMKTAVLRKHCIR